MTLVKFSFPTKGIRFARNLVARTVSRFTRRKRRVLRNLVSLSHYVFFFARLVLRTKINTFFFALLFRGESGDGIFSSHEHS